MIVITLQINAKNNSQEDNFCFQFFIIIISRQLPLVKIWQRIINYTGLVVTAIISLCRNPGYLKETHIQWFIAPSQPMWFHSPHPPLPAVTIHRKCPLNIQCRRMTSSPTNIIKWRVTPCLLDLKYTYMYVRVCGWSFGIPRPADFHKGWGAGMVASCKPACLRDPAPSGLSETEITRSRPALPRPSSAAQHQRVGAEKGKHVSGKCDPTAE